MGKRKNYQNFFSKSGRRYLGLGNAQQFYEDVKVGDEVIGSAYAAYALRIGSYGVTLWEKEDTFFLGKVFEISDEGVRLFGSMFHPSTVHDVEIRLGRNAWKRIISIDIL